MLEYAMHDPAVAALARLIAKVEGGQKEVARRIHANDQTLYQIVAGITLPSGKPRTVGRDLRERLDREFPGWLMPPASEAITPSGVGEKPAQSYTGTLYRPTVPAELSWEALMADREAAPVWFQCALPDGALAPERPAGRVFQWRRDRAPKPGAPIIVLDRHKRLHVRIYHLGKDPGTWQALPTVKGFPEYGPEDGATIYAVAVSEVIDI